jgi:hypothetical protein
MNTKQKLAVMQSTYAAALAEAVSTYGKLKVLDYVVEKKKERQAQTAPIVNKQMGVESIEDVFALLSDTFGCANWTVEKAVDGYVATATSCKLCALCKKMGDANPCRGWCLDPMAAMIAAVSHGQISEEQFIVKETLMDGDCCKVLIKA